jgi:HEPN domain-containing protein
MASRAFDWFHQAQRDLDMARTALDSGFHEWACFSAQQAAEKAVKAVFQHMNGDVWGHAVKELLEKLAEHAAVPSELIVAAQQLDRNYIPTRYPNGLPAGTPQDYYNEEDARRAIDHAQLIVAFCKGLLPEHG